MVESTIPESICLVSLYTDRNQELIESLSQRVTTHAITYSSVGLQCRRKWFLLRNSCCFYKRNICEVVLLKFNKLLSVWIWKFGSSESWSHDITGKTSSLSLSYYVICKTLSKNKKRKMKKTGAEANNSLCLSLFTLIHPWSFPRSWMWH